MAGVGRDRRGVELGDFSRRPAAWPLDWTAHFTGRSMPLFLVEAADKKTGAEKRLTLDVPTMTDAENRAGHGPADQQGDSQISAGDSASPGDGGRRQPL